MLAGSVHLEQLRRQDLEEGVGRQGVGESPVGSGPPHPAEDEPVGDRQLDPLDPIAGDQLGDQLPQLVIPPVGPEPGREPTGQLTEPGHVAGLQHPRQVRRGQVIVPGPEVLAGEPAGHGVGPEQAAGPGHPERGDAAAAPSPAHLDVVGERPCVAADRNDKGAALPVIQAVHGGHHVTHRPGVDQGPQARPVKDHHRTALPGQPPPTRPGPAGWPARTSSTASTCLHLPRLPR
jgi:hypothetical protein